MKKLLIILSIIFLALVFIVLPKISAFAQIPSFEIYPFNKTPYPSISNAEAKVSDDKKSVLIKVNVDDVSEFYKPVVKIRSEGSSNYINIGSSATMQEADGYFFTSIDISNDLIWFQDVKYLVDISVADVLNNTHTYQEATSFKFSLAPAETEAELWTNKTEAPWGSYTMNSQDPYNTYFEDSRSQFIVIASDLTNLGMSSGAKITAISLKTSEQPYRYLANFKVQAKLKLDAITTSWEGGWTDLFGPTNISQTDLTSGNWQKYVFSQPLIWDGTKNIMFNLSRDDGGWTAGGGMYIRQGIGENRNFSGRCDSCTTGYPDYTPLSQMVNGSMASVYYSTSDCPAIKITFSNP
jgi:hypothetical protein